MRIIGLLVIGYACYAILLLTMQRWVMYPGARMAPGDPGPGSQAIERIWLDVDGGRIEAWYVPSRAPVIPGPAIILFHGNAEFIDDWPDLVAPLVGIGVPVLLVEFPGYGRSEGSPSQETIVEAAVQGFDWLTDRREVNEDRIFALGRSLGSGVAAALSEQRPVAGLVLISPFSSIGAIILRSYGLPPALARDPFDTRRAVAGFEGPVLIFHGREDRVIPHRHATDLAAASPRVRLISWDCGHNDCPPSWPALWSEIGSFIENVR